MNLLNSKKAIIGEVMAGVVALVMFGYVIIFSMLYYTVFVDGVTDAGFVDDAILDVEEKFHGVLELFDYITIVIAAVLIIGIGIVSKRVASAPVFFVIVLISSTIMGLLSYFFNYLFVSMISDTVFSTVLVFFPRTMLVCTNLHWIALAMMTVGSITLYGKREKGQFLG